MAKSIKIRRVVNPRKKKKRSNPRRKLSAKQIRIFGTKRQKAALRSKRTRNARKVVRRKKTVVHRKKNVAKRRIVHRKKSNPVVRRKKRNVARRTKRSKRANPAPLVLTLGSVNPPERRMKVARKQRRKKSNPRRKTRSRKNATRVVVMAPAPRRRKKSNPRRTRKHSVARKTRRTRRNPEFLGTKLNAGQMVMAVGGGLLGVAVAKLVPPLLPSQLTSSNLLKVVTTVVTAWAAGWAAGKFINAELGSAVMFGGFMQAGSVALNTFLPSVGAPLSLGAIVPGRFPIPQNPILDARNAVAAAAAPAPKSRVSMSGLERAFGASAF